MVSCRLSVVSCRKFSRGACPARYAVGKQLNRRAASVSPRNPTIYAQKRAPHDTGSAKCGLGKRRASRIAGSRLIECRDHGRRDGEMAAIGNVSLWRYVVESKNYRGRHLTADDTGCASLLHLLDLLQQPTYSAEQVVALTPPTEETLLRVGRASRCHALRRWKIVHSKPKHAPDHWQLTDAEDEVTLALGTLHLAELRKGIEDVAVGRGDYCIGGESQELWFW